MGSDRKPNEVLLVWRPLFFVSAKTAESCPVDGYSVPLTYEDAEAVRKIWIRNIFFKTMRFSLKNIMKWR